MLLLQGQHQERLHSQVSEPEALQSNLRPIISSTATQPSGVQTCMHALPLLSVFCYSGAGLEGWKSLTNVA